MEKSKVFKVKVTQLIISKPFLKVHVKNISNKRFSELSQLEKLYKQKNSEVVNPFDLDSIYIARVGQSKYERVRIVQVNDPDNSASVYFIDSGYHAELPSSRVSKRKKRFDYVMLMYVLLSSCGFLMKRHLSKA